MKIKANILSGSIHNERFLPAAVLLAAVFICGAIVGSTCAAGLSADSGEKLADVLFGYCSAAGEGALIPSFPAILIRCLAGPMLIWLMGFTAFGVATIPVTIATKGFMLGYTLSILLRLFGARGALFALAFFSAEFFIIMPCVMIVSVFALFFSGSICLRIRDSGKEHSDMPVRAYFLLAGISVILLVVAALAEYMVLPGLFTALTI